MTGREKSEIRKLAEFIRSLTWEQIPPRVQDTAAFRVLDLVSVAAGASWDPLVDRIAASLLLQEKKGDFGVWGRKETYSLTGAVMVNAMLAHTLELDDVHPASKTHGSASLIPAAWSCAQYLGRTGKEFLTAVVCGYETVNRIGMALGVSSHRNRGWHATATCGVFGSAAACAKLLNLDAEQIVSALGMAGTQSCGVWAFLGDGSSCKILHTARAAVNGLEAAFLAQAGMTGPEHILDAADGGLLTAMSDGGDIRQVSEGLGQVWEILNMDRKPYPCCRSTHCAVDCALELRKQMMQDGGADPERITRVQIRTYLVGYKQCAVSEGCLHLQTPLDAKFSTPYAVAAALLYGRVTMEEFRAQVVASAKIQALLAKVQVEPDDGFTARYPRHWGCSMKIIMEHGAVYETEVQDPSGSADRPLSREQAVQNARELLGAAYAGREEEVIRRILNMKDQATVDYE